MNTLVTLIIIGIIIAILIPIFGFVGNIFLIIFNGISMIVMGITGAAKDVARTENKTASKFHFERGQEVAQKKLEDYMKTITPLDCVSQVIPTQGYEFGVVIRKKRNPRDTYGDDDRIIGSYAIYWEYPTNGQPISFINLDDLKKGIWFPLGQLKEEELINCFKQFLREKEDTFNSLKQDLVDEGSCRISLDLGECFTARNISAITKAFVEEINLPSVSVDFVDFEYNEIYFRA